MTLPPARAGTISVGMRIRDIAMTPPMRRTAIAAMMTLGPLLASCGPSEPHKPTAIEREARARLTPRTINATKSAIAFDTTTASRMVASRELVPAVPSGIQTRNAKGILQGDSGLAPGVALTGGPIKAAADTTPVIDPYAGPGGKARLAKRIAAAEVVRKKRVADSRKRIGAYEARRAATAAAMNKAQLQKNARQLAAEARKRREDETKRAIGDIENHRKGVKPRTPTAPAPTPAKTTPGKG